MFLHLTLVPLYTQLTYGFRYLPVMISRIMLSMRKAADSPQNAWSLAGPHANCPDPRGANLLDSRKVASCIGDDVPLDTYRVIDGHPVKTDY